MSSENDRGSKHRRTKPRTVDDKGSLIKVTFENEDYEIDDLRNKIKDMEEEIIDLTC